MTRLPISRGSSCTVPVACIPHALTEAQREQSRVLRSELEAATTRTEDLPDGYSFTFRADAEIFHKAAQWIALERVCCPFFAFELTWKQGPDAAPRLVVTGPRGTKEFMSAQVPAL